MNIIVGSVLLYYYVLIFWPDYGSILKKINKVLRCYCWISFMFILYLKAGSDPDQSDTHHLQRFTQIIKRDQL